jgi:sugar O-acyltransferase (sialic acid O-acetyltransferase NeuD family)
MSKSVIVIGAGGHGAVVLDALLQAGVAVQGLTDIASSNHGAYIQNIQIMGDDSEVLKLDPSIFLLFLGVGIGGGDLREGLELRRRIFEQFKNAGFEFGKLIHSSAIVSQNVDISSGAQVMAGAVLQVGVHVGENTIINTRASVDHDCHIGANCHVSPGVILGGGVVIGDSVHVSIGAVVAPNIKIGNDAVIAAGAVIIKDVPSQATVYGIPAKEKNDL